MNIPTFKLPELPLRYPEEPGFPDTEARLALEDMAVGDLSGMDERTMLRAARRLGIEPLRRLHEGGVRLKVLNDPQALGACYLPQSKTLQIAGRRLSVDTVLHEMGHALDDLAAPDLPDRPLLDSERNSEVARMHREYCDRVTSNSWWQNWWGGQKWSDYAMTNPHEYVADGVMNFTRSQRSNLQLKQADPALWAYVKGLVEGAPGQVLDATA